MYTAFKFITNRLILHKVHKIKLHVHTVIYMIISNQNHFYCHITTAQVPWWVKFLWACSRQCKKTTTTTIYIWTDSAKKTTTTIYIWTDSAKKQQQQFTYGQCKKTTNNLHMDRQCKKKKKTTNNLHMDRQCKKAALEHLQCSRQCKKTTTIYIWTVHIYMFIYHPPAALLQAEINIIKLGVIFYNE